MAVRRDQVAHGLLEVVKLLAQAVVVLVTVKAALPANAEPVPTRLATGSDLAPVVAEIRELRAEVREQYRDVDRRLLVVERRP